ncbi:MAG: DsbA family protein [Sulfolobaceae archaeon]|nr:DsbA family protein [Sulfolobales archaeon]
MVVELTFFHDVICPYCYVQNLRLRRVLASFDRNEVRVIHKAFAIISDLDALKSVAFTEEEAREVFFKEFEIIKRYVPDYDLEGVKKRAKFSYVWSVPPLRACKAAEILGGNEAHGRFFEEAQKAFFEEGLDVTDEGVLANIAERVGLNKEEFVQVFRSRKSLLAYEEDEAEAKAKGIRGVPAILLNEGYALRGLQSEETLSTVIEDFLQYGEPKRLRLKLYWES